jgi:hypothetical protein
MADGHLYEREAIARWFRTSSMSPMTGAAVATRALVPNRALKQNIEDAAAAAGCPPELVVQQAK